MGLSRIGVAALLAWAAPAANAGPFLVNGLGLGVSEARLKTVSPALYCKPLEWESRAADRRCDDARFIVGGVSARATFFLKGDRVQGYDLRFPSTDLDRVKSYLSAQWGAPATDTVELIQRKGKADREIYKVRWANGRDSAVLTSQRDKKRTWLSVAHEKFEEEIYRVR